MPDIRKCRAEIPARDATHRITNLYGVMPHRHSIGGASEPSTRTRGRTMPRRKARGVLIFPSVIDTGFVSGGQYGEGLLRVDGHTVDHASTVSGSLGWQIGANGNVGTVTASGQVDAFVLTNNGLMVGASLEGTKVTRLDSL